MSDFFILSFLLLGGFVTGLINSIAGGGGLISIPLLISIGIPINFILGTNKLQATIGSFTASTFHISKKIVNVKKIIPGIIFTALGAIIGATSVQFISSKILDYLIPILLFAVLTFTFIKPKFGLSDSVPKISENIFYIFFGLSFGFYDGFFGPGVGSFWTISFSYFLGYNFSKATSHTSVLNFVSNFIALIIFLIGGKVLFFHGIVMGVGQFIGSKIGAKLVFTKGAKFVKPIFILMVFVTIVRLILKNQ